MNKLFVILTFLFTLSSISAQETEATEEWHSFKPKNTIYVAPFNALAGEIKISYERQLTNNQSVVIDLAGLYDRNSGRYGYYDYYGYGGYDHRGDVGAKLLAHYRKYIVYKNMKNDKKERYTNLFGLYVDVFGGYQYANRERVHSVYDDIGNFISSTSYNENVHAGMGGFLLGNRFDFAKGKITLSYDAGFAVKISAYKEVYSINVYRNYGVNSINKIGYRGIRPQGNIQFGFNF